MLKEIDGNYRWRLLALKLLLLFINLQVAIMNRIQIKLELCLGDLVHLRAEPKAKE